MGEQPCCTCAKSEHKDGTCVQCHHYALAKRQQREGGQ